MKVTWFIPGILGILGLQACGGAAVPHQELTAAETSVRAAEVAGAEKLPQAELRLKHARDGITTAKQLIEEGKNERATFVLQKAESDAELALSLAEEGTAKAEAEEALKRIQQLKKETQS